MQPQGWEANQNIGLCTKAVLLEVLQRIWLLSSMDICRYQTTSAYKCLFQIHLKPSTESSKLFPYQVIHETVFSPKNMSFCKELHNTLSWFRLGQS